MWAESVGTFGNGYDVTSDDNDVDVMRSAHWATVMMLQVMIMMWT